MPTRLPPEHLSSLKDIYRKIYRSDISDDDAHALGIRLLETLSIVLRANAEAMGRERRQREFDSRQVSDMSINEPSEPLG